MQCSAEPMRACASEQWPLLTDEGEGEGEGRRWQGVEEAPPAWTSTAAGVLAVQRRARPSARPGCWVRATCQCQCQWAFAAPAQRDMHAVLQTLKRFSTDSFGARTGQAASPKHCVHDAQGPRAPPRAP